MSSSDPYFYCLDIPAVDEVVTLTERESRHAGASRRLGVGSGILLTDGAGTVAEGCVTRQGRARLEVRIVDCRRVPAPVLPVRLACAVPKGERASVLLDMVTQLGVTDVTPLVCARSVVALQSVPDRWQRIVIEACKQSRRAWFPCLDEVLDLQALLTRSRAAGHRIAVADVGGEALATALEQAAQPFTGLTLVVGPEGGFTAAELACARRHGARLVRLGDNVLRVETAAVVLVGAARALLPPSAHASTPAATADGA